MQVHDRSQANYPLSLPGPKATTTGPTIRAVRLSSVRAFSSVQYGLSVQFSTGVQFSSVRAFAARLRARGACACSIRKGVRCPTSGGHKDPTSRDQVPPPFHILPLVWLFTLRKGDMGPAWCLYCSLTVKIGKDAWQQGPVSPVAEPCPRRHSVHEACGTDKA